MTAITIEAASAEDASSIHKLIISLAKYEKAENEVQTTPEQLRSDFVNQAYECLLAKQEGKAIGMALFYPTYSTWKGKQLYLEDLIVLPEYRNQKVGQRLFDQLKKIAIERSCTALKWQVLDWNHDAVRFYERNDADFDKGWWNVRVSF